MSRSTLSTALLDPATRPRVVDALLVLADAEISTKKGISGTMLKTAFAGAKKASESNVRKGIDRILPGMARSLDPHYDAKGDVAFGTYLSDPARSGQVADELLAVADSAATRVEGNPLGKVYSSFRGKAKEHVVAALPRLGATLETFVH
ncbi:hypothetical protein SGUI_1334 [Serinicoccus hydrothermalis]|uniref:Uncharacterized protein n=1 Tax=Serinicoccus hydrothermalis TaxID=1758689 RepID=A0A1B1NBC3_9MICO|nr:hypothetical protein [Serinicoccus hydrothermalis]ANS78730.1 hypothetical protein SGUI_1334 [Serinicoccus hydrothermalis]